MKKYFHVWNQTAFSFLRPLAICFTIMLPASIPALAQSNPGGIASGRDANTPTGGGAEQKLTLPAPSSAIVPGEGSVEFIGNATVLIRYAGFTVLTDPNFLRKGEHAHLGYGLKSERLTDPSIAFDTLPSIDLVLLSHMHGDHFDQQVQKKLDRNTPIVTTPDAAKSLQDMGFKAPYPLRTWETLTITKGAARLRISSMPARHGPSTAAVTLPETMGSILDFSVGDSKPVRPAYRIYISGDTLVFDDIKEIPRRFPEVDLALLHLGGTRILGMLKVTMDGQDGVQMMHIITPRRAIPIHYNDYDVFKSPLSDFQKEARASGLDDKVTNLKHGEVFSFRAPPE